MSTQLHATAERTVTEAAAGVLEMYASAAGGLPHGCGHDAGPAVLASLTATVGPATGEDLRQRVVRQWLNDLPEEITAVGAFGGLGGFQAGVRACRGITPGLSSLADVLVEQTPRWLTTTAWRTSLVAWRDYDLFTGPAGLLLAGAAPGAATPFVPVARHLATLCDDAGLERLRAGVEIDPRSAWSIGRINTGLGHGVTGVAAALRHAVETVDNGDSCRTALDRACSWLAREVIVDARGLITWPPIGQDGAVAPGGASRRQAWCYGTPGVAWTLWDAGRVLGDQGLRDLATEAMRSFCTLFDESLYIDTGSASEALGICHGVAGTLAVADAFARHTGLLEAAALRDHLNQYLVDRIEELGAIARTNMSMLTGAGGIASVLLTVQGGPRDWLPLIALR